jgi:hypothetical protein
LPRPVDEGKQQVLYLPLPAPENATTSAPTTSSFKLEAPRRGRAVAVGGLPLPPPSVASKLMPSLPAFEYRDLMVATDDFAESSCLERSTFGAVFSARLKDPSCESTDLDDKMEATVLRLPESHAQGCLEWRSEVQLLAQISSPNVCAVKGYCTHETGSRLSTRQERLLVFEQPYNGPLSDHLFGNRYLTYLDWRTRIEIALSAARGLLYIHERAPVQVVYKDFCASNVLLDRDFSSRLAGYGLSVTSTPSSSFKPSILLSQAHAKNNVWSFGIFLLELLTGKNSRDAMYLGDDENFLEWGRPYFKDEARLWQIIDSRMREQCPMTGAMEVVDLLLQCVSAKESLRPPMAEVVESLQIIKAKYCSTGVSRSKNRGPASWLLSPQRRTRLSRDYQSLSDLQFSSDASSSSENEDLFTSRLSPRPLRVVV